MAKKKVTDKPRTAFVDLPKVASPLARTDQTYSRAEVRKLREQSNAAEKSLTKQLVRARKSRDGMTPRQKTQYRAMEKGAFTLSQLAEYALKHPKPEANPLSRLIEDGRLARQHFKTATGQVAKLFKRKSAGAEPQATNAKARSH